MKQISHDSSRLERVSIGWVAIVSVEWNHDRILSKEKGKSVRQPVFRRRIVDSPLAQGNAELRFVPRDSAGVESGQRSLDIASVRQPASNRSGDQVRSQG